MTINMTIYKHKTKPGLYKMYAINMGIGKKYVIYDYYTDKKLDKIKVADLIPIAKN